MSITKEYRSVFELGLSLNRTVDPSDAVRFEDDNEYYGDMDYMTNSKFGNMDNNVHEFFSYLKGDFKYPSKQVYVFGRFVHVLCLEPHLEKLFHVAPKTSSEQSRKNSGWAAFLVDHPFDWSITEYERNLAYAIRDSYFRTDGIAALLERATVEKAYVGYDPFGYGLPVKGKLDIIDDLDPDYLGSTVISDIKTSGKKIDDFQWSIKSFKYLRPAVMYMELSGADAFKFHPIHKGGGHAVGEFVLERDSRSFKQGMLLYEEAVDKFNKLYVEGNYSDTYLYSVKLP